ARPIRTGIARPASGTRDPPAPQRRALAPPSTFGGLPHTARAGTACDRSPGAARTPRPTRAGVRGAAPTPPRTGRGSRSLPPAGRTRQPRERVARPGRRSAPGVPPLVQPRKSNACFFPPNLFFERALVTSAGRQRPHPATSTPWYLLVKANRSRAPIAEFF